MRFRRPQLAIIVIGTALFTAFQNCSKSNFNANQSSLNALNGEYGGPAICDPLGNGNDAGQGARV